MWVFPKQVIEQQATEIIHPSTTPYHPLTMSLELYLCLITIYNFRCQKIIIFASSNMLEFLWLIKA